LGFPGRVREASGGEDVVRLEPAGRKLPGKRELRSTNYEDPRTGIFYLATGGTNAAGVNVNESTALGVSAVTACVSLLADMIAKLPIELFQRTKNGPKPIPRHPAIAVINRPSDLHTSFELRQLMMLGKGLGGNGYARVYRDGAGDPVAMEWLKPCDVIPDVIKRSGGDSFAIYKTAGQTLTRQDVVHIKWISRDGIRGISPVALLRESIGTALAQTAAAGKLMRDGTTFPGYLISNQTLSADKIRDAREEWQRNHGGAANAGRVPILNGSFDFKQTNGMSMVDAEFIESRRFELQEIARHFRIPPFLIGDSTASTTWGTGIQEQTLGFLNFCLDPHLIAFEQALEAVLLTSDELAKGYYFRFDRDELASVSRQDTATYFQTMRGIGVYSVNDIRRKLDEPIIPAESGGDDYSLPFNNTGGAAAAKAAKEPPAPTAPAE
jgi:HK97 family phage portal protein